MKIKITHNHQKAKHIGAATRFPVGPFPIHKLIEILQIRGQGNVMRMFTGHKLLFFALICLGGAATHLVTVPSQVPTERRQGFNAQCKK